MPSGAAKSSGGIIVNTKMKFMIAEMEERALVGGGDGSKGGCRLLIEHATYRGMYVWPSHIARVRINRVRLPILLVVS